MWWLSMSFKVKTRQRGLRVQLQWEGPAGEGSQYRVMQMVPTVCGLVGRG